MPINCTSLLASGTNNFSTWKSNTSAAITSYQAKGSTTQAEDDTLLVLEKDMLDASLCLTNAIAGLNSTTTSIADLNQQILQKSKELSQAEEDIGIAKDRVGYLRHPERNTSSYESWFPIDRPISTFSLILILCITLFLGVFLILLALSYSGFNLTLFVDPSYGAANPILQFIMSQFTASFWLLLIAFSVVFIYYVRR
jgi:peptidoglycan hydrolase-like protein with peptidoglycan-binding domain